MSQLIPIVNLLTPAVKTAADAIIVTLRASLDPVKINLTQTQTKGLLKVGAVKEAQIDAVETRLMIAHPETLPTGLTEILFAAMSQEEKDSDSLEAALLSLAAIVGGHSKIMQNNRMYYANQALDNGRQLAKTVPAIATEVNEISTEFFSKTSSIKVATVFTIAPGAEITVTGVETESMFTNEGTTILKILVANGLLINAITLNPASGVLIPKGWTKIVVTNVSVTNEGQFSLFMQ